MSYFKHESAYVDEGCQIGEGTKIWHFAHVQSGAKIGKNCILGQNVNIANDVVLGDNVKIQNNVAVYTGTTVESDVFLGPSCVLTNVTNPRSQVKRHSLYEKILIRRGATVGANATIVCGITLGRYSFVAAGATIAKDVPDYVMVMGCPAKPYAFVSRHGHILCKFDEVREGVTYICPESNFKYAYHNGMMRCLDLDEEAPLPPELSVGEKDYDSFKCK